jgi:hypothetical protein
MYQQNNLTDSFDIRSDIVSKMNFSHPFFKSGNDKILLSNIISLYIGKKWIMLDDSITMRVFFEALPFFYFATGHCICSGLGMGIRETLLLQNKNVSKLTILENNLDLIEYHKINKTPFVEHVEIIHCSAFEYVGSCDTLFLDHYNDGNFKGILSDIIVPFLKNTKQTCNNIEHNNFWFRGLEEICINSSPSLTHIDSPESENIFDIRYRTYLSLQKKYPTLPNLDNKTLNTLLTIYENKDENLNFVNTIIDNFFIEKLND